MDLNTLTNILQVISIVFLVLTITNFNRRPK